MKTIEVTPWAVLCHEGCGPVCLTEQEYQAQMARPDATWRCPACRGGADWLDAWEELYRQYLEMPLEYRQGWLDQFLAIPESGYGRDHVEMAQGAAHDDIMGVLDVLVGRIVAAHPGYDRCRVQELLHKAAEPLFEKADKLLEY